MVRSADAGQSWSKQEQLPAGVGGQAVYSDVKGEILMVNIGSTSTGGRITAVRADLAKVALVAPVCTAEGEKIALSRRVDKHWRCMPRASLRTRASAL